MQARRAKMQEDLAKLQQMQGHLEALEQLAASYPENHSTRLVIESLQLHRARTVIEGEIVPLRESLGSGVPRPIRDAAMTGVTSKT
jgi:hypothetical protein